MKWFLHDETFFFWKCMTHKGNGILLFTSSLPQWYEAICEASVCRRKKVIAMESLFVKCIIINESQFLPAGEVSNEHFPLTNCDVLIH